jgi:hypothetical protein
MDAVGAGLGQLARLAVFAALFLAPGGPVGVAGDRGGGNRRGGGAPPRVLTAAGR